jgi:hypothetical protein
MKKKPAKVYRRREDYDQRFESIHAAVMAILNMPDAVKKPHKRRLLNTCLWQLTQSESYGKRNLRYATKAACKLLEQGRGRELQHEHVHTRKQLIDELMEAKPYRSDQVGRILRSACACLVTVRQHKKLCERDPHLRGWERYESAKLRVYERDEDRVISYDELLNRTTKITRDS